MGIEGPTLSEKQIDNSAATSAQVPDLEVVGHRIQPRPVEMDNSAPASAQQRQTSLQAALDPLAGEPGFVEQATQALEEAKHICEEAAQMALHKGQELKEGAQHAFETARIKGQELLDSAQHKAHDVAESASHAFEEAKHRCGEAVETVKHTAQVVKEGAQQKLAVAQQKLADITADQPTTAQEPPTNSAKFVHSMCSSCERSSCDARAHWQFVRDCVHNEGKQFGSKCNDFQQSTECCNYDSSKCDKSVPLTSSQQAKAAAISTCDMNIPSNKQQTQESRAI
jgi:hypothetical protein